MNFQSMGKDDQSKLDTSNKGVHSATTKNKKSKDNFIVCKNGNWVEQGTGKIRQLQSGELATLRSEGKVECGCAICKKRKENGFENTAKVDVHAARPSRTQDKRWRESYGEGRTLG